MTKADFEDYHGNSRRCLIQFLALDYAVYFEEIGIPEKKLEMENIASQKEAGQKTKTEDNDPQKNRSLYLFLQDMLPSLLLYPRVLCELKKVEDLNQKIWTLTGVRPSAEIQKFFSEMIQGFGSANNDTGVTEAEEFLRFLFDPESWENADKVRKNVTYVIKGAGLNRLIEASRGVPCLIHTDNSLDIGIRYNLLQNWAKLTNPEIWNARIETVISLDRLLPNVEGVFLTSKSTSSQQDFFPTASRVMKNYLRPAIELHKKDLNSLLREPNALRLRSTISILLNPETEGKTELIETCSDHLGFLETTYWVMSDQPYLYTLFDRVRSRLIPTHPLRQKEVIPSSLFQGCLKPTRETAETVFLSESLARFKQDENRLIQLGICNISKLAGGYKI